ncbi:MAG: hypothetical protein K9J17_16635 [Flavobacteriales bacterium]|nr:hypothetical protein [Flavobacteriales bacterium]
MHEIAYNLLNTGGFEYLRYGFLWDQKGVKDTLVKPICDVGREGRVRDGSGILFSELCFLLRSVIGLKKDIAHSPTPIFHRGNALSAEDLNCVKRMVAAVQKV